MSYFTTKLGLLRLFFGVLLCFSFRGRGTVALSTIRERTHVRVFANISLQKHFSELVNTRLTIWNTALISICLQYPTTTGFRISTRNSDISRNLMFFFCFEGYAAAASRQYHQTWETRKTCHCEGWKNKISGKFTWNSAKTTGKSTRELHGRNFQARKRFTSCKVQQLHKSGFVFTTHQLLIFYM